MFAYVHIDDFRHRTHRSTRTDRASVRFGDLDLRLGHGCQLVNQLRPIAVQTDKVGELRVKLVEQDYVSPAAFVEHLDLNAVTERCARCRTQRADVFDPSALPYIVVGDLCISDAD